MKFLVKQDFLKKKVSSEKNGIPSTNITINEPVVYMARDVMILMWSNPFRGLLESPRNGRAQESLDFQGPPLPMALDAP